MRTLSQAELHHILRTYRGFAPAYGDRLTNHLPMAITALWQLGADAARIHAFAAQYCERLSARTHAATVDTAHAVRIDTSAFEAHAAFFADQLDVSSTDEVLHRWIPKLVRGPATTAFHGLIRTAYAVEAGCHAELADALAYWMAEYVDFPNRAPTVALPPRETVHALTAHFREHPAFAGIIMDRMASAARDPWFGGHPGPRPSVSLQAIRREVLDLYACHDDFTLLHTVTATHAMRVLQPYWGDERLACACLWQGILLAIAAAAADLPDRGNAPAPELPDASWQTIVALARDSMDGHVVKLIHTAHQEFLVDGCDLYRRVAARRAGISADASGLATLPNTPPPLPVDSWGTRKP